MEERQLTIVKKYNEKLVACIETHLDNALIDFSEKGVGPTEMRLLSKHTIQMIQTQDTLYAKTTRLIEMLEHNENGFGALMAALKLYGMEKLAKTLQEESCTLKVTAPTNAKIQKPWNAPLKQTRFVGRDGFMQQLHTLQNINVEKTNYESPPTKIVAVCFGLGGVGKSSLALEYVYRTLETYDYVFWVPATTREETENCLAQLGMQLCLQAASSNAQIWRETMSWLQANPGWLIVLDDAPMFSVIQPYIPRTGGFVLVTSRYTDWPYRTIQVTPFSRDETMEYLNLAVPTTATSEECASLAQVLGDLPLAISQATAYMRKLGISVQEYLVRLKTAQRQVLSSKPDYHRESIYLTWNVSIEQAKLECGFAAELLQFCSLLNENYVPETLICEFARIRTCSEMLETAQAALLSYSLMSNTSNSRPGMSMHPLVQVVTQSNLTAVELHNYIKDLCLSICNIWPNKPDLNHAAVRDLYPSLEKCLHYQELEAETFWAHHDQLSGNLLESIQYIAECAHRILGYYTKQKIILEQMLQRKTQSHGPNHINVAITIHKLGNAYGSLGDFQKKKELLEQALVIQKRHYGPDHVSVAHVLSDLGNTYGSLGDYQKEKELQEKALVTKERHYGSDHVQVAITLQCLGNAYGSLGDYQKQKELQENALVIQERYYGPDHVEVAFTRQCLGNAYGSLGDYQKQKELQEEALVIQERYYGPDHIEVAFTLQCLGNAYGSLGDYQKQKELLQQALVIQERHYGPDHVHVARILYDLGNTYGSLGDYQKQKELQEKALVIQERHYGPDHVEVAITLQCLGNAYGSLGDFQKMKELLQQALSIKEKHNGTDHADVPRINHTCGSSRKN